MKKLSLIAMTAAAGMFATSASAADLGGDCCADLEERISELEQTTARKGNRKVSLTISGHVNEMVTWWDDGFERNFYQTTNTFSTTRFRLKGSAKIQPGLSAGYYIEIQVQGAGSSGVNQNNDDGGALQPNLRQSNWWLKSDRLGKITVGQGSPATDDIILANVSGTGTGATSDVTLIAGGGFFLRNTAGALITTTTLGEFAQVLDTNRRNVVRYDTPTFMGAYIAAAYGEDDYWDVALWFKGTRGRIKYAGGIGYLQDTEGSNGVGLNFGQTPNRGFDFNEFKGSVAVMDTSSGLFADFMWVHREFENVAAIAAPMAGRAAGLSRPDFDYYYVRAGIRANLHPVGATVFWGDWSKGDDGITGLIEAGFANVTDSELTAYGLGVVQHINPAAMELYFGWKHYEVDVSGQAVLGGPSAALALEDFDFIYSGARIKF